VVADDHDRYGVRSVGPDLRVDLMPEPVYAGLPRGIWFRESSAV